MFGSIGHGAACCIPYAGPHGTAAPVTPPTGLRFPIPGGDQFILGTATKRRSIMPCCLFQSGPGCTVQIESVKITICDSMPFASKTRCPRAEALARLPCDGTQRERTVNAESRKVNATSSISASFGVRLILMKWIHVGIFQYTHSRYLLHPPA